MLEAMSFLDKEIFAINTVLERDHKVYYLQAGDIYRSFEQSVEKAKEVFVVSIPREAEVVVTVAAYPMDVDLYQAQKALENGRYALKDGGIIILVAQCREGVGDATYLNLLSSSSNPQYVLELIGKDYKLGYHKAAKLAELAKQAKIWAITELEPEVLKKAHIQPWDNLQKAVEEALKKINRKAIFLLDGSMTVPRVD
jgi:nickel-dependent lactate racemase